MPARCGPAAFSGASGRGCEMKHRKVRDVMTRAVTVTTSTRFKDLARMVAGRGIGALPVLGRHGAVVGVVSEADLLAKAEFQHDPGSRPAVRHRRVLRAKAAGDTAGDVMTRHPVTVRPDATVAEAARLLSRHNVSGLPVVDENGALAGIVGPRDVLGVFLRPDREIRAEIIRDVLAGYLGTNPALVRVDVTGGLVTVAGEVERKSMLASVAPAVRAVDGVIGVRCQLSYAIDDTRIPFTADLGGY